MTHDPMCPVAPGRMFVGVLVCECDLIARVVERERERAAERVEAAHAGSADENECTESIYAWNLAADAARGGDA